jgi:hypothetical protein
MDFLLGRLVPLAVYGGMFGYPVLQYLAIYWTRGRWQVYAALPLVPMAILLAVVGLSGSDGSNSWLLLLVLMAPLALVYLAILLTAHRRAGAAVRSTPKRGGQQ